MRDRTPRLAVAFFTGAGLAFAAWMIFAWKGTL